MKDPKTLIEKYDQAFVKFDKNEIIAIRGFLEWLDKEQILVGETINILNNKFGLVLYYLEYSILNITFLENKTIIINKPSKIETEFKKIQMDKKYFDSYFKFNIKKEFNITELGLLKKSIENIKFIFFDNSIMNFKIREIDLVNFRKFEQESFKFDQNFTVLIGANGTGKTTILDGLAVAIGGFLSGIDELSPSESNSIDSEKDVRFIQRETDYVLNSSYQVPVKVSCYAELNGDILDWTRALNNKKKNSKTTRIDASKILNIARQIVCELREEKIRREIILPVFAYHGTGRLWKQKRNRAKEDITNIEKISRFSGYKNCLEAASDYNGFIKWFSKMKFREFKIKKEIGVLKAISSAIEKVLNSIHEEENIKIKKIDYDAEDVQLYYEDGKVEPVTLLSDGYRNIIGVVADIAYRMAILNPDLKEEVVLKTPGIVLIDEIDLHLHPKWQRKFVSALKETFPLVQFITTTHSPFIIQSLDDGELLTLDNEIKELGGLGSLKSMGIEDITKDLMGEKDVRWSSERKKMFDVAQIYYQTLEKIRNANDEEVVALKEKLDELTAPHADNVAYAAYTSFLKQERMIAEFEREK